MLEIGLDIRNNNKKINDIFFLHLFTLHYIVITIIVPGLELRGVSESRYSNSTHELDS